MEVKIENLTLADGQKELIVRTGSAVPVEKEREPLVTRITGIINAPYIYLEAKKELFEAIKTLVIVNDEALSITFKTDERSHLGCEITGKLERARLLGMFGVNAAANFSDKTLAKLLRKLPFLFSDRGEVDKMYSALMKFQARVTTILENSNDNRGNIKILLERSVETELPQSIVFDCPIFEGQEKCKFTALLCCEATNQGVVFYFDSPELYELEEKEKKRILEINVQKFVEYGSAVLYI